MNDRAATSRVIEVRDPFTREIVGTVPKATVEDVRRAFAAAHAYHATFTRFERAEILRKAATLLRSRVEAASDLITRESGLCKKDSLYEVGRVCDVFEFSAIEALRDDGQVFSCDLAPHGKNRRVFTRREPLLGVISAITPFNHPMNQVAHKVAPAIATNNRIVVKPSEKTPLSALWLVALLHEAGVPEPMLQAVTGDPAEIGDELITNGHVDLVTFTGGVPIGKSIAAKAGYPSVQVPAGMISPPDAPPYPLGATFAGRAWSEPLLLRLAYAFEQASLARRPPPDLPPLDPRREPQ